MRLPRHRESLAILRVAENVHLGQRDTQFRPHRGKLDTVEIIDAAFAEMIGHRQHIFAIGRHRPAEVTIGANRIIVCDDRTAIEGGDGHDRIERRAESTGVAMDVEDLTLLRREAIVIDFLLFRDNPVQRQR